MGQLGCVLHGLCGISLLSVLLYGLMRRVARSL